MNEEQSADMAGQVLQFVGTITAVLIGLAAGVARTTSQNRRTRKEKSGEKISELFAKTNKIYDEFHRLSIWIPIELHYDKSLSEKTRRRTIELGYRTSKVEMQIRVYSAVEPNGAYVDILDDMVLWLRNTATYVEGGFKNTKELDAYARKHRTAYVLLIRSWRAVYNEQARKPRYDPAYAPNPVRMNTPEHDIQDIADLKQRP